MPRSLLDPTLEFDEDNWVVSVFSYKPGPGHAKLVIESLQQNIVTKYIISEYDITYTPQDCYGKQDKYRVNMTHKEFSSIEAYNTALNEDEKAPENSRGHIGLREFYQQATSRSKRVSASDAKNLITNIKEEKKLNDAYHKERIRVVEGKRSSDDLNRWIRNHNYDPTYQMAVLSVSDTIGEGINCAIWVDRKAKLVNLQSSLPTSSASVPKLATHAHTGWSTGRKALFGLDGIAATVAFFSRYLNSSTAASETAASAKGFNPS